VSTEWSTAVLHLAQPALVAPGQAAVLYRDDEVIGGGVVDRPLAA
jgi:tRNA U34 2-thiouridine synthase MnmA/TrmU